MYSTNAFIYAYPPHVIVFIIPTMEIWLCLKSYNLFECNLNLRNQKYAQSMLLVYNVSIMHL